MTLDTSKTLSAGINLVRQQFPALDRPAIFLDNPAGTQISKQSIERINRYLVECNANHEGMFETSRKSDEILHEAHAAMADFYHAARPEEIVFGNPVSLLAEEGKATQEAVWEYVRQELRLAPEEVAPFRQAFFGGDQVDFDLVALIRSLRPAYRTALLSNGWMTDLPRFLHQDLRIPEDTFDFIMSSASHGLAKPKPAIFHLALEMTGAEPAQAIFVDDNEQNIRAARALGLHAIHFHDSQQAQAELRALIALSESSR